MEPYYVYLALLAAVNIFLARHIQRRRDVQRSDLPTEGGEQDSAAERTHAERQLEAGTFQKTYFAVYALVFAADWLQGPYIYSVYKTGHGLPESTVAALFATGFVSAGTSASFVGAIADTYGRRKACLIYCAVTAMSCLSILSGSLPTLFVGRILGGVSATLLYSVFEAWMVSEHQALQLEPVLPLNDVFSWSVTISGLVAIIAGVLGEAMIKVTGANSAPFMSAIVCLGLAAAAISIYWNENYGGKSNADEEKSPASASTEIVSLSTMSPQDRQKLYVLGLATTAFEGSMYLFVFFWTPALTASRSAPSNPHAGEPLPLGVIFSCFMAAMMLGSMVFSILSLRKLGGSTTDFVVDILTLASSSLLCPVLLHYEVTTFWSFALFEATVGMYYPTMGRLKSELVPDAIRAKVYSWMRLPLNVLVVLALGVTREGDDHRDNVFIAVGGLLLLTGFVVRRYLI